METLIINGVKFYIDSRYVLKDGKIYRNTVKGLIEDNLKTTRKVGKYKIHAEHFNCALPYSVYYLIDTEKELIYKSEELLYSALNDIVDGLKKALTK